MIVLEVARPGPDGGRPLDLRRPRPARRRQGVLRAARLRPRPAKARLRGRPGWPSSTFNLVKALPALEERGVNVKVVAAISEELFDRQPAAYRDAVLPPEARYDLMVVTTGTRRVWPLRDAGPLTGEYSLVSDWHDRWLDRRPGARRDCRGASRRGLRHRGGRAVCGRARRPPRPAAGRARRPVRRAPEPAGASRTARARPIEIRRRLVARAPPSAQRRLPLRPVRRSPARTRSRHAAASWPGGRPVVGRGIRGRRPPSGAPTPGDRVHSRR